MSLIYGIQEVIKQSIDFNQFVDITYGEVVGVKPLKVKLINDLVLEEENLILTNAVKDHTVDISVQWTTEDKKVDLIDNHTHIWVGGAFGATGPVNKSPDINSTHKHDIKGKKKIIIHNDLKEKEQVLLIKAYGGQQYVIVDRITEYKAEGQWEE